MAFTLGGVIKGVGSILGGAIKASPIGGAISTIAGILKPAAPTGPTVLGNLPAVFTGQRGGAPQLPALGPGGGVIRAQGGWPDVQSGGSTTAPGRVVGHWKKNGQWSNRRRPRMNPMNVRAARRAVSRINAAEKLFRRILRVSSPEKATRRITPKRKR